MMYGEQRARTVAATVWRAAASEPGDANTVDGPGGDAAAEVATPVERRVLPDGCMDLIWSRAAPEDPGQIIVAGPDTTSTSALWRPGARYLGLRFDSAVGPAYIGVPASEVRD